MESLKTYTLISFLLFQLHFLPLFFQIITATENPSSIIISRFQEYLKINTAQPNPNYKEAAEFILSQAESLSLESQTIEFVKDKPLIVLKWPGKNPKLQSVVLNSHTDVVPVESSKWVHDPFGAHIDFQGNIYARGSQVWISIKFVGLFYVTLFLNQFDYVGIWILMEMKEYGIRFFDEYYNAFILVVVYLFIGVDVIGF